MQNAGSWSTIVSLLIWCGLIQSGGAIAKERRLSEDEILKTVSGRILKWRSTCTVDGRPTPEHEVRVVMRADGSILWKCRFTSDGRVCPDPQGRMSSGVWRVHAGMICAESVRALRGGENCSEMYQTAIGYLFRSARGFGCGQYARPVTVEKPQTVAGV